MYYRKYHISDMYYRTYHISDMYYRKYHISDMYYRTYHISDRYIYIYTYISPYIPYIRSIYHHIYHISPCIPYITFRSKAYSQRRSMYSVNMYDFILISEILEKSFPNSIILFKKHLDPKMHRRNMAFCFSHNLRPYFVRVPETCLPRTAGGHRKK